MDFAKYTIVVLPVGQEQAVRFPTSRQHKDVAAQFGLPVDSAGHCAFGWEWA